MSQPFSALHCNEQTNVAEAQEAQIQSKKSISIAEVLTPSLPRPVKFPG